MAAFPTPIHPTIVLIGLRGAGKSTVARYLARHLGLSPVDLDDRTPRHAGEATVAGVFANQGETAFRAAESRALFEALAEPDIVLALGGGTPTAPGAADLLRDAQAHDRAAVVYLRAPASDLAARLASADNAHRPALSELSPSAEIATLYARRDPLYTALARVVIEVAMLPPEQVARRVLLALGRDPR